MAPVLTNKEKRDRFLITLMLLTVSAFLFYIGYSIFETRKSQVPENRNLKKTGSDLPNYPNTAQSGSQYMEKVRNLLQFYYMKAADPEIEMRIYHSPVLEKTLDYAELLARSESGRREMRRWRKQTKELDIFAVCNPVNLEFPVFLRGEQKFALWSALFVSALSKTVNFSRLQQATAKRIFSLINMEIFGWLGNRLTRDYQIMPVMMLFRIWLDHAVPFPKNFFADDVRGVYELQDGTPQKKLSQLQKLLEYSSRMEPFDISWQEDDGLLGTDRGENRANLFPVRYFLGQRYLLLPDRRGLSEGSWLIDIARSDAGKIELTDFELKPVNGNDKGFDLYFNCSYPDFIVLMHTQGAFEHKDRSCRLLIEKRVRRYTSSFKKLTRIYLPDSNRKKFTGATIREFGHFLKKLAAKN